MMLIVTGLFEREDQAEDAYSYLLGNGFAGNNNSPDNFALKNIAELQGCNLKLTTQTVIEAQEGADVLNNYGAIEIHHHS